MERDLDHAFSCAVLAIAEQIPPVGWDIMEDPPASLAGITAHWRATGRLAIYSGHSDRTIYGAEGTNLAFRAWHDWTHIVHQCEFTAAGEFRVCEYQCELIRTLYIPSARTDYWCRIIDAEINGQGAHKAEFGQFPEDQRAFVVDYLARSDWREQSARYAKGPTTREQHGQRIAARAAANTPWSEPNA